MQKLKFNDESELHTWIAANINRFLGEGLFLNGNFFIYTRRNKGAKPDGYFIDFAAKKWTIIETELLAHGVWPHIAEQITRFSIASKNFDTLRILRDSFFAEIERKNQIQAISERIGIPRERLIHLLENIIETTTPNIAIFIDEINEDLEDLAESLNTPISIYKVQKFSINNAIQYYSEDYDSASFQTTVEAINENIENENLELENINNDSVIFRRGRTKFYANQAGERYLIKNSRRYDNGGYWYGISSQLLDLMRENQLTHIIFQMGTEGFLKVPLQFLDNNIENANKTYVRTNGLELVSHYHIHINRNPNLELLLPTGNISIEEFFHANEN